MAFVQLNPWYKPSGSGLRGNDSALVPFLNKNQAHYRYFGEYKKANGRMKEGSEGWRANREEGTFHLVGTDSCEWDLPVRSYEAFLEQLFNEDSSRYKWFFIEPMYHLHKMYLDFDFKTPDPVDYDAIFDAASLTCALVYHFFFESTAECYMSTCEPYLLPPKPNKEPLYKSGIHFYFGGIVTNSVVAMKCRHYVVQELFKVFPDTDWEEVVDEAVFNAEPGSMRGALRLNNTFKMGYCREPACKAKVKAKRDFLKAHGLPDKERNRRAKLDTLQIYSEAGIPFAMTTCCTEGKFADGRPYRPWRYWDEDGIVSVTYETSSPYTNWSILVPKDAVMSPYDKSLVVPVKKPKNTKKRKVDDEQEDQVQVKQNQVTKDGVCVTMYESDAMNFINREIINKLAFRKNDDADVCPDYATWISPHDGFVRPYRNAQIHRIAAYYNGDFNGGIEKKFTFFLPLTGPDQHNCYGGQHASNQAKFKLTSRKKGVVTLTLACFKKGCQFHPRKVDGKADKLTEVEFACEKVNSMFRTLVHEAGKLLGLRHLQKPSPFDAKGKINHTSAVRKRPHWPPLTWTQQLKEGGDGFLIEDDEPVKVKPKVPTKVSTKVSTKAPKVPKSTGSWKRRQSWK